MKAACGHQAAVEVRVLLLCAGKSGLFRSSIQQLLVHKLFIAYTADNRLKVATASWGLLLRVWYAYMHPYFARVRFHGADKVVKK